MSMPAPSVPPTSAKPLREIVDRLRRLGADPLAVVPADQHARADRRRRTWCRMSISGVPVGTSTTAGAVAEPPTVSMTVPGSSGMPTALYSHGPSRAAIASWEYVSALDSRVGRPITPLSLERTLRPGGMCASPLMPRTSAPPSPEMNRCGTVTIRVGTGIRRSASAAASDCCPMPSSAMPITISSASSAAAASAAPSRIRCGPRVRTALSFQRRAARPRWR